MKMKNWEIGYPAVIAACLLLLVSSAACQKSKQQPCLKLKEKVYSFDAVHQGDFYDVALRFEAKGCDLAITPELIPRQASWSTESNGGLQVDEQSFVGRPLLFVPELDDRDLSQDVTLTIRVSAPPHAAAGKRVVRGVLRYQALAPSGPRDEQLALEIPVKVVPAGAAVPGRRVHDDQELKWYQIALVIAIFPIAFLVYLANEC